VIALTNTEIVQLRLDSESRIVASSTLSVRLCFLLLFKTGCRYAEATDGSRWSRTGVNQISLQTVKRGAVRLLTDSDIPQELIFCIDNGYPWPISYSRKYHEGRAHLMLNGVALQYESKRLRLHFWRHAMARQMLLDGLMLSAVRDWLGLSTLELAGLYSERPIFVVPGI